MTRVDNHGGLPALPEEVEAFAATLTDQHLYCRVWGHDPEPHNIVVAKDTEGVPGAFWDAFMRCSHGCGVRWRMLASQDGEVLRRRLDYSEAKDYLSTVGRIDAGGRQILRRRYLVGATNQTAKSSKRRRRIR